MICSESLQTPSQVSPALTRHYWKGGKSKHCDMASLTRWHHHQQLLQFAQQDVVVMTTATTRTKLGCGQEVNFNLWDVITPVAVFFFSPQVLDASHRPSRLRWNTECCGSREGGVHPRQELLSVCGWRRLPGGPSRGFLLWLRLKSDCCVRVGIEPRWKPPCSGGQLPLGSTSESTFKKKLSPDTQSHWVASSFTNNSKTTMQHFGADVHISQKGTLLKRRSIYLGVRKLNAIQENIPTTGCWGCQLSEGRRLCCSGDRRPI